MSQGLNDATPNYTGFVKHHECRHHGSPLGHGTQPVLKEWSFDGIGDPGDTEGSSCRSTPSLIWGGRAPCTGSGDPAQLLAGER
jgi:hypothetical protein